MEPALVTKQKTEDPKQRNGVLRDKKFRERNSLIDDLMENKHVSTVHRMSIATILGLIIYTAVNDYANKGVKNNPESCFRINFGQNLIIKGLENFSRLVLLWNFLFLLNLLVYFAFKYWATVRTNLVPNSLKLKLWDYLWFGFVIVYYPGWLYFTIKISRAQEVTFFLLLVILTETIRMLMKVHAFLRSNIPRVLNFKGHTKNDVLYPTFSQFMYFFWAPTLIYRDIYPRTDSIRWNYLAVKLLEFVAAIFWISVFMERYIIVNFKDYGIQPFTWSDIIVITISNTGAGMMLMITSFYIKLHLWMGTFAEICRFADRLFYEDWWTSTNYERYYRTWNIVVYDWLFTYVYKDFYEIIVPGNKIVARVAVFFLSAIFHDYILTFAFGFYIPYFLILFFVCGTTMSFVKMKPGIVAHVFFLYSVGLGSSIAMTGYGVEYYARQNCPVEDLTFHSYFVPRFLSCPI